MHHQTVTLIGMPGAGKSTVGVLLAKLINLNFVDSDLLIQVRRGENLQTTLDSLGYQALRKIEEEVLLSMSLLSTLVATGGSAVYSEPGMRRLHEAGPVVYIAGSLPVLEQRVPRQAARGIACPPGQSFADVYRERTPLYEQHADITVDGDAQDAEATAYLIASALGH